MLVLLKRNGVEMFFFLVAYLRIRSKCRQTERQRSSSWLVPESSDIGRRDATGRNFKHGAET